VFGPSYANVGSVSQVVPVDLEIKGCPPQPMDLLRGLITLTDRATAKESG
jgi:Ni,Fe-hydrogenase III small subunit